MVVVCVCVGGGGGWVKGTLVPKEILKFGALQILTPVHSIIIFVNY